MNAEQATERRGDKIESRTVAILGIVAICVACEHVSDDDRVDGLVRVHGTLAEISPPQSERNDNGESEIDPAPPLNGSDCHSESPGPLEALAGTMKDPRINMNLHE